MWTTATFPHLAPNATSNVVTGQQLRRTFSVLIALRIAPPLFFRIRSLVNVERRNILKHESLAIFIPQHSAFPADTLRDQNAAHARRPDHPSWMELHKFHIHQRGAGLIGERVTVARVFPAVARDFVCPSNSSSREHHRLCAK